MSDGTVFTHVVHWEVKPRLTAVPEGLIFQEAQAIRKRIILRSDDRPFRVLKLSGIGVSSPSTMPSVSDRLQSIEIEVDGAKLQPGMPEHAIIATDHPDQPEISISLLRIPNTSGSSTDDTSSKGP